MKILIVDDNEEGRYLLEVLLRGHGYEVESAADGVEALEKASQDGFDMIISDILMPRMDGFQLCRKVKTSEKLKNIAFVFYTSTYTDPKDEEFALSLGAEKFIAKPTEPDVFIEILREVITSYETGTLVAPKLPVEEEPVYFKRYNERLVRKLEDKMLQLENANKVLTESERKYRELIEIANDAVIVLESTGYLSFVNPKFCEMTGYSMEEVKKLHFSKVIHPEDLAMVTENFRKRLSGEEVPRNYELRVLTKTGEPIYIDYNSSTIEREGKIVGVLSIIRDITERKRAEEKARELGTLKELDRLRSGLLANVSHELRTPLTSIKGFASTLLDPEVKWSEEEQRDFLQTIDQESNRLTRLISDLLDMSRLEASALKLERDKYQVSKILDSINDRLTKLTEQHQLKVIVPAELPPVFVDEMRIGQVLINLVENATKFSPKGSEITIEAQLAGDQINISVTDRGQGIAPELLDKVFDRFYQAESIVAGRKGGTGLGLSICRGIVEAHGGKIWVESKVGEGSKFSFSLPVSKGNEENA